MFRIFWFISVAAFVPSLILFTSVVSANSQSTQNSNAPGTKIFTGQEGLAIYPKVVISTPTKNSSLHPGSILVTGIASPNPGGAPIKTVAIHFDKQMYINATSQEPGNWSHWYAKLNIPIVAASGSHIIQARATDIEGIQSWWHVPVYVSVTNTNGSSLAANISK
jgi:hypothetical protein